jgi:hypothetical protein
MIAIAETRLLNADRALSSRRAILDRYQDMLRRASRGEDKETGDNASCDRRTAQSHQPHGSFEHSLAQDAEP